MKKITASDDRESSSSFSSQQLIRVLLNMIDARKKRTIVATEKNLINGSSEKTEKIKRTVSDRAGDALSLNLNSTYMFVREILQQKFTTYCLHFLRSRI